MANSTSATRSIQKIIPNPGGVTNSNYLTNQIIYYSFLSGFNLISKTTGIYISVNASVNNASSFKVDLATCGDISVTAVSFFLISCDVTAAMATYTRIIDLYYWQMLVNVEKDGPIPVTDISTQTFYRNNIYGLHHLDYPIGNVAFYLNNTAYDSNLLLFYGIHQRMRSCPERTPYYYHAVQLCFDVCPSYTYTNTSFNFCVACKYSCSKCDNPLVSLSCTQCASSDNRVLNGTNCDCAVGYFQQPGSIATCGTCNYRCVTCTSSSNLSCSSCDVTLHRQFANGNSCPCLAGYY